MNADLAKEVVGFQGLSAKIVRKSELKLFRSTRSFFRRSSQIEASSEGTKMQFSPAQPQKVKSVLDQEVRLLKFINNVKNQKSPESHSYSPVRPKNRGKLKPCAPLLPLTLAQGSRY